MGGTNSIDLSWLTRLPSIQYLNLNKVNLSTLVDWPLVMNMIPSLRVLDISGCSLARSNQPLPHLNLTNLEELDASENSFNHPMETSWFWNITWLKYLNLGHNSLYGQIPDTLVDMVSLQVLDLSYNDDDDDDDEKNKRIMTTDLRNLCNLEVLNLHWSLIYGDITELFRNLLRCSPSKLQDLDLGGNQLSGMLPRFIGQLTSLVFLDLGSNDITGTIPKSVGQFSYLQSLDLSYNHLTGHVPYEIGMLSNLTSLDLSNNRLDGIMTEEHFASARSLQDIYLSYNALKIELSSDWQPPFQLKTAGFAACQMGPLFPRWLQWQVGITDLDISSAGIADRLPQWFSDTFSTVDRLDVSNNQLSGSLPTNMSYMSLSELYLSSNQLTGQIPTLLPNLLILDLSSNQITGHIPESFCKYWLAVLDLSNNLLGGELPSCLGLMEDMEFIALSNNSFSGEFPSVVQNFTSVLFLDLSRNKLFGSLPTWIGKLKSLRILRLSHNMFYGNIPVNITNLDCLQYLDLNNNGISGSLPTYLSHLKAMTKKNMTQVCYDDDIDNFHLISPSAVFGTNMMSIDLSSNNLTGKIPEEITTLDALVNLNLSWNQFSGVVPNNIGEMQSLEALDLSRNMLSGEIPATLSKLTFLSYLDLSYNNLAGTIP
ncbi:unnamed protein product [Urochloa humidicola]